MGLKNINKHTKILYKYIANRRLNDAFEKLYKLIDKNKSLSILKEQVDKQANIYKYMLMYSFTEIKDPDRDKVYDRLLKSLYQIADHAKYLLFRANDSFALNQINKNNNVSFVAARREIEQEFLTSENEKSAEIIFKRYWLLQKLEQNDIDFLQEIIRSDNISWINEALIVSALTTSLLLNFDSAKLRLLFDFYYKRTSEVWQRAVVGIVLGIHKYSDRIKEYTELSNEIKLLANDNDFTENMQSVVIQLIKTKDTQKITQKLHNEILPEVAKYKPTIEERLKLQDIADTLGEDKNPDWEKLFEDAPEFINKLEELSHMQIEGSDIFMATFAMLKHFEFFNDTHNWFLPFYEDNPDIPNKYLNNLSEANRDTFLSAFEKAAFLCNSDKYSLIMNINEIPEAQRNMMLEMLGAELESMNEIVKDAELVDLTALNQYKINQYVQDLYRFYKLYAHKDEFDDIFENPTEIYDNAIMQNEWFSIKLFKNIAALYFKSEYYEDAIKIYKILINKGFNEQIAFEQIAYSYQKLGDFKNALSYYQQSELFDKNLKWLTKKIALCYRELNNPEKAIEFYKKAEETEPENLYVQANLGHSYLLIKDYENALKHYFKVEYFAPSNKLIQRPIAWCSFVLGKFETSIKYYKKIIEQADFDWKDLINYGHTLWCNGSTQEAIETYRKAVEISNEDKKIIRATFLEDKEFLIKSEINIMEIKLMLDYIYQDFA